MAQGDREGEVVRLLTRPRGFASGPQVLDELRRVIVSGLVPPGTTMPLDDIADFFGVSRIPVREAYKTLLGEGLLEHRPRLGYTVTRLTDAEIAELYAVAGALEAVALAAAVEHATARDRERLRETHERLDGVLAAGSPSDFHRLTRQFHEVLLRPCGMPRLLHMLTTAWNLTEPVQAMRRVDEAERGRLCADHGAMLAAFLAGDIPRLQEAARVHQAHIVDVLD